MAGKLGRMSQHQSKSGTRNTSKTRDVTFFDTHDLIEQCTSVSQRSTFWGALNISLCAYGAQLGSQLVYISQTKPHQGAKNVTLPAGESN